MGRWRLFEGGTFAIIIIMKRIVSTLEVKYLRGAFVAQFLTSQFDERGGGTFGDVVVLFIERVSKWRCRIWTIHTGGPPRVAQLGLGSGVQSKF